MEDKAKFINRFEMKKTKNDAESVPIRPRFNSFSTINEKEVNDISLEFFYKPHSITLLLLSIGAVVYFAFVR